jgi:hypothetical protein
VYLGLSRAWVGRGVPGSGVPAACCGRPASESKGPPSGAPPGAVPGRPGSAECGSPGRRSCPSPGTPRGSAGPGRPVLSREPGPPRAGAAPPRGLLSSRGSAALGILPLIGLPIVPGIPPWPSPIPAWPAAGPGSAGAGGNAVAAVIAVGSTVTASWMLRPSSRESACVISARSRVSSCSLTNSLGVAISAVFSTSPSGRVSFSHARWCGSICMVASSSSDLAHTSARSVSLIARPPLAPPRVWSTQCDQQLCPQVVHAGYHGVHGSRGKSACGRDPRARLWPPPAGALSTA